jgi:hypothetical protein
MIYPNSNLPTVSQAWGRAIQKGIETLEATVNSNDINNRARDAQLQANYVQTNKNIQDIKFALTKSGIAVTGVNEIKEAIYVPGTTQINGASIKTGTLTANMISAGTLTGSTVKTATDGYRVELQSTSVKFWDNIGNQVGSIYGGGSGNEGTLLLYGPSSSSALLMTSDGTQLMGSGGTSVDLGGGNIVLSGTTTMNDQVYFYGPVDVNEPIEFLDTSSFSGTATFSGSISSSGIVNTGGISNSSGNIVNSGTLSNTGNINSPATYANNVQTGRVMYVAPNGTYNCATSSARYKQDINPYFVDVNKFFQLEPVSFRYKMAVEQFGESANIAHGFIAEQAAEVGMDEFVDFEPDENGNLRPDNFRYIDFTAAMYGVIKSQQQTIESLTARIEALESKV